MLVLPPNQPPPEQIPSLDGELRQHGITRVRFDYFEVNGFRYSNAQDAIAEAKRHPRHVAANPHGVDSSDPERG